MCRREFYENSRIISVPTGRKNMIDIPLTGIRYVEVFGRESLFHLSCHTHKTLLPLREIEKMLGGVPFLRCHRCYIVNMNYIDRTLERDFLMLGGERIPISKENLEKHKAAYGVFVAWRPSWEKTS